jgi:hypothetical protein
VRRLAAGDLRALRRAQLQRAVGRCAGEPRFAVYVLVPEHGDPAPRLADAHGFAARQGWAVAEWAVDVTGPTAPGTRPQLARLLAAARRGEIHGILAASRVDVSDDDREYEAVLRQLQSLGVGLALAREETGL